MHTGPSFDTLSCRLVGQEVLALEWVIPWIMVEVLSLECEAEMAFTPG